MGKPLMAKNRIRIASMLDLAATKIKVLQDRAEVKDYIDICALVNNGITLDAAISAAGYLWRVLQSFDFAASADIL